MPHAFAQRSRLLSGVALLAAGALALAGCSSTGASEDASSAETEATDATWPRTFENADGTTTEIPEQPTSIVSTSASTTGTLLAIDAPVVASASAANGEFFAQWADVAEEQGVENLFAAGEVDLEAVYAADPDLIVVSTSGADSLIDNLADLQEIAPTIVVDYGAQTWQDLAEQFGEATGLEAEAEAAISEYEEYVAEAATKITVPEGTANIISFNGPGENNNIARAGSVHGDLLESLGFELEDPPAEWNTLDALRTDFIFATYENLTELTSETTFVLSVDDEGAQAFAEDPTMANVPSVAAGQVYGLGANSFRIDKYSAIEVVDGIVANFGD